MRAQWTERFAVALWLLCASVIGTLLALAAHGAA